ncbi:MAG TPA: DUF3592 domain-containing protein [Steroidobacteraceae bacterium]|nr:DUF3592 domain-containing protein [Steroidobacteraceae bacterium]HRX89934.1 DUF3592 domain-containing protein [Steroidobacteraceae bacterium]
MRLAQGIVGIAGYGLAGVAAISLLLGGYLAKNTLALDNDARETTGTVVGHVETSADGKPRYAPLVAFTTATGERVEFRGQLSAPARRWVAGQPAPVRYLASEPKIARVDSFVDNWLGASVALGLGLIAAIAAFVLVRSAKRELAGPE